ncbi:MAG: exodeoxyribonuclease VII large subunit [Rikenellaceae bacterium]
MATSITLSELQLSIKGALSEKFPLAVWVTAEISELKVNYSGHCYLELVEKIEGKTMAKAQSRAVIWRSSYAMISSHFRSQTGQELAPGLKVLIKVLVNYHELYGLSLQITDIDPTYTLGEGERERQLTIARLKKEGVWDMNREQPLPTLLQNIAIISSANAAGYQDFCNEIGRSKYHFALTLFDAYMQGAAAEESIVAALEAIASSPVEYDAVVIIRGGGSVGDLQCFDGYRVASHVAQFPLPIIAGIGHDKDVSVVDMVAAKSLKTPTAVATMLVERMAQLEGWLEGAALALHDSAVGITRNHFLRLEQLSADLSGRATQLLDSAATKLENLAVSLPERAEQLLALQRSRLEGLTAAVELHSPAHLMRLGYAVARAQGAAIRSGEEVSIGQSIMLELIDSEIIAEIKTIEKKIEIWQIKS